MEITMPEPLKKHLPVFLGISILPLALVSSMMCAQSGKPAPVTPPAQVHSAPVHAAVPHPVEGAPVSGVRSEAHPAPSPDHSAEKERRTESERNAEPEHRVEPERGATPEQNAEPNIEREQQHFSSRPAPPVEERLRDNRNTTTKSTNGSDGTTTTTSVRDGYTTVRITNRDGRIIGESNNDPREARSSHASSGSTSAYPGVVTSPMPPGMVSPRRPQVMPFPDQDPAESQAALHQLNEKRARLIGINKLPIPDGRVVSTPRSMMVATGDGRRYTLRPDGTLARFQSGMPAGLGRTTAIAPAGIPVRPRDIASINSQRTTNITQMGTRASFRPDGSIISLHTSGPKGLNIQHGVHGERVITAHRPDHSTLVSTGRHSGYLERSVDQDDRTLIQRTYVSGNRTWQRTYSKVSGRYTSMAVNGPISKIYIPRYSYQPAFYGWVNQGWMLPINYRWNWASSRWYAYYRSYFFPWTSYPDGSYWLTDYVLVQTLADGYDMQQPDNGSVAADASTDSNEDSSPADPGQQADDESVYAPVTIALSSAVKQEIAAEVHQKLAAYTVADAGSGPAQVAAPDDPAQFLQAGQIFIVSTPINVRIDVPYNHTVPFGSQLCNLSPGDILRLTSVPSMSPTAAVSTSVTGPMIPSMATLEVVASLRADCPAGAQVMVQTLALQEMENDFQARLDDGLHVLYSQQGKDGLPTAPPTTAVEQPDLSLPAPSAASLGAELQGLQAQANKAEANIAQTVLSAQATTNQP
jgi:hypothetical protein